MKFKNTIKTFAVSMALVVASSSMVHASTFNDVPSSHWAYSAIDSVSNKGLIVGDLNGNFSPDSYVDKFSTSKIVARLLGYKATGATASDQKYYDDAYEKNKNFLSLYKSKFSKWDSSADREISFLIERGVLTAADLDQFIIISQASNTEALTAITREDIALLLVRAMDKTTEANASKHNNLFNDDASITSSKKSSVYYLRAKGIINGDSTNNFNPKSATTKATLAILVDKVYEDMYGSSSIPVVTNPGGSTSVTTVTAVSGVIDVYYDSLSTLQLRGSDGTTQIYRIDDKASITVDGLLRTKNDLKANMGIIGVVTDGKILIDIKASSATTTVPTTPPTTNPTDNSNNTNPDNKVEKANIEGIVSKVDNINSKISVDTRIINPRGEIITTTTTYKVSSTAKITRANVNTTLSRITSGDIIYGKVEGNELVEINLEAKDIKVYGKVLERSFDTVNEQSYYVIEDEDDRTKTYKLYVNSNSVLKRTGSGTVSFNNVKIGDSVEVHATFNIITELYASGKSSYVAGTIKEIYISEDDAYFVVQKRTGDKEVEKYYASPRLQRIYDLEIGSSVDLTLDSKEIVEIDSVSTTATRLYTGYVNELYRDSIIIREKDSNASSSSTVYYDSNTMFVKSSTGTTTNAGALEKGDQIIVSYNSSNTGYASIITIIK